MPRPKLTKLELRVLDALWEKGLCSVREIQETFPRSGRPAYTTVQTTVYRLERKKFLRCVKRISNANIFEAANSRADAQRRLVDDLLELMTIEELAKAIDRRLEARGKAKRTQTADFADYAEEVQNEPKPRITRIRTKRSQAGG